MTEINIPISILEFGSTHVRVAIYDKLTLNQILLYEQKINFIGNDVLNENHPVFDLIMKAEKKIGQHLNEVLLVLDNPSISSLDFSIQKNFEQKIVSKEDLNYLVNECEQIIKSYNKEKNILHVIISSITYDGKNIENPESISNEVEKVTIEIKFILIDKKDFDHIKNLLLKKHISLLNVYCASYIKSLGLLNKLSISNYSSFIDIGLKKSSLTVYKDNKLLYLNNIHIAGSHITKDISKVLKIDIRKAEAEKLKFSKRNKLENNSKDRELLKNIVNARLEEIIELLFIDCPLIKNNIFDYNLKLFFTGNGSRVLNENLLSFGSELNFIKEMTIIEENKEDCCESAIKFNNSKETIQPKKSGIIIENKGFFEKLFDYFTPK